MFTHRNLEVLDHLHFGTRDADWGLYTTSFSEINNYLLCLGERWWSWHHFTTPSISNIYSVSSLFEAHLTLMVSSAILHSMGWYPKMCSIFSGGGGWICWWIRRFHFFNYQLYLLNIPWQVMGWWLYSCNVWFCFQPPSFLVGPCRGFIELVGLLTCTSTPPCIWYSYYGRNISVCSHLSFATFHNKSNQIDGNARERIGYRNTEKIRRFKMGLVGLPLWEPAWNWWTEWPF